MKAIKAGRHNAAIINQEIISGAFSSLWTDPTAQALVFANLLTLVLAVWQNWDIVTVLLIYWCQSIIIGIFNVLRILSIKKVVIEKPGELKGMGLDAFDQIQKQVPSDWVKIGAAIFFTIHYGFFHFIYLVFLLAFAFSPPFGAAEGIDFGAILIAVTILFVSHLFSFVYHFKEERPQSLQGVMMGPYVRIIPMHFIIVFGGIFILAGVFSQPVIAVFLLLKTGADLIMHYSEHSGRHLIIEPG